MNIQTSGAPAPILPGQPRRSRTTALVVVLALLVLAGGTAVVVRLSRDGADVKPDSTGASTPPATSSPTVAGDPQAAAKTAVLDAYRQSYSGFVAVGKEPSPSLDDPRLIQYSTGAALEAKRRALADHKAKGQVYVGDFELHPTVIELGPTSATVVDCAIDRTALVDGRTGSTIVGAGAGQGSAGTAKLILDGGRWKVSDFKDEKRSCAVPAA